MKDKKKLDVALSDEAVHSRRKMEWTGNAFLIEDSLQIKGSGEMTFVMCDFWLLQLFELHQGNYHFRHGNQDVLPHDKRFAVFYPPFALMKLSYSNISAIWYGVAGRETLPAPFPDRPVLFRATRTGNVKTLRDVHEVLSSGDSFQFIEANPSPSLLSIRAKKILDQTHHGSITLAAVAKRLGVTHSHLTRQFKSDFGLTPGVYRHEVRVSEAMFRLGAGENVIDVSQDVGYNDLSRFYGQFRKKAGKTPRFCQAKN